MMKSEEFTGRSAEMKKDPLWLSSEDLLDFGDVEVTIEAVFKHIDAEFDGGRKHTVFALKFVGKEKQLILNNTNRKRLVEAFGTTKLPEWKGRKIKLYVDQNVKKPGGRQGEKTCGIRVKVDT